VTVVNPEVDGGGISGIIIINNARNSPLQLRGPVQVSVYSTYSSQVLQTKVESCGRVVNAKGSKECAFGMTPPPDDRPFDPFRLTWSTAQATLETAAGAKCRSAIVSMEGGAGRAFG
jgi:hypothetical protein